MKKTLKETIDSYNQHPNKTVFVKDGKNISAEQFLNDINVLVNLWSDKLATFKKIALAIDDIYLFASAWVACQYINKTTIMLPNNKTGTQKKLSKHYDAIVYDHDIDFSAKSKNDFKICLNNSTLGLQFLYAQVTYCLSNK